MMKRLTQGLFPQTNWIRALLIGVILGLTVVFFQNCSGQKFGTADISQVDENSTLEAGRYRTVSLASKYSSEYTSQPVKIAIIVDNSGTMANSQDNLARNLSSLFSEISKYDAEVALLSTDWRSYNDPKSSNVPISSTSYRYSMTNYFKRSAVPTWSISKVEPLDSRILKYEEIGNKVKQLGVSGSDDETPLQTLAFAIDGMPEFFSENARVLVYIITDENDNSMATYVRKNYETIVTEVPAVPVVHYFATATYQTFFVTKIVYVPQYDDGVFIGHFPEERRFPATSAANCNAQHSPPDSICSIESFVNIKMETSPNYCDVFTNSPGYLFSSCVISEETRTQPGVIYDVIKDEPLFFIDQEQNQTIPTTEQGKATRRRLLHAGLMNMLNSKFKENYLVAVQANLQGQNCTMGDGQSYDLALKEFSQVLPQGQFFISSICDASALSGQGLKKISERLDTIISKTYRLKKAQNEVIQKVKVVTAGKKVVLTESQYKFENGILELLDAGLINFDSLEVDLTSI